MRQGNGMFQRLTHTHEGDRGQTGWDCERTGKGGRGPIIPLMPMTRNEKETMHSLVFHLDKAEFVSSRKDGSRQEVGK